MGLLTFVKGITSTVGKTIERATVIPAGNFISNVLKKGSGTMTVETFNQSKAGKLYTNTLGAVATAIPIAVAGAGTVAKVIATNPIKTGAVIVAGSILAGSEKAQNVVSERIVESPADLTRFGTNIATTIENPSISNIKKIVEESPLISSAIAVAGTVAIGKVVAPVIASAYQSEQVTEQTQAIKEQTQVYKGQPAGAIPQIIQLPATSMPTATEITQPKPSKRKKAKKKKKKAKKKKKSNKHAKKRKKKKKRSKR